MIGVMPLARRSVRSLAFVFVVAWWDQLVVLSAEKRVGARLPEYLQALGYDFAGACDFALNHFDVR